MDDKIPLGRVKGRTGPVSSVSAELSDDRKEKEKEKEDPEKEREESRREKEDPKREREDAKKEEPVKEPLLPRSNHKSELWPVILTKAILKVAALE